MEFVYKLDGFEAAQRFARSEAHHGEGASYRNLALCQIAEARLEDAHAAMER